MFDDRRDIFPTTSFGLEWPRRRRSDTVLIYDRSVRRPSSRMRPGSPAYEQSKPRLADPLIVALDPALSGSGDHAALVVIEAVGKTYDLRFASRRKGQRVGALIENTQHLLERIGGGLLVLDRTGLGLPIYQQFQDSGLRPFPVVITGSSGAQFNARGASVPSRDLVNNLQIILEQGRLRIARDLPALSQLETELLSFQVSVSDSGHARYAAAPGCSDDFVFALMLALYVAEKTRNRFSKDGDA